MPFTFLTVDNSVDNCVDNFIHEENVAFQGENVAEKGRKCAFLAVSYLFNIYKVTKIKKVCLYYLYSTHKGDGISRKNGTKHLQMCRKYAIIPMR